MPGGRPEHKPTQALRKMVEANARICVPQPDIALLAGITEKTLTKYYREELDRGHAEANQTVLNKLFQGIKDGDKAMIIFYCKTRLGWKETQVNEIAAAEGLQVILNTSSKTVTDETN